MATNPAWQDNSARALVYRSDVSWAQPLAQRQDLVGYICKQKSLTQSIFPHVPDETMWSCDQSRGGLCAAALLVGRAAWGPCKVASSVQTCGRITVEALQSKGEVQ